MRFVFYLLAVTSVSGLFASTGEPTRINTQGSLEISGDITLLTSHANASLHGKKFRGQGSTLPHARRMDLTDTPFGTNAFAVEATLMFDYQADRSWAFLQLEFDNQAGKIADKIADKLCIPPKRHINSNKNYLAGSGTGDNIFIVKAFTGYSLMKKANHEADIQIGRHLLQDVFDSVVQFNDIFDGVLFHYNRRNAHAGIFSCSLAAFVIDATVNHYGYVGEFDFLGIGGRALDLKYSLISWDLWGSNRYGKKDPLGARFINSQATCIYHLTEIKSELYGAFVHNHKATGNYYSDYKRAANAFYVGAKVGQVKEKNDWAIDANYQWVEAQSVPEWDVAGIGRFNPTLTSMYTRRYGGFANYKGYAVTGYYALTDNITLQLLFQQAKQLSKAIGGTFHASTLQLSTIYSF